MKDTIAKFSGDIRGVVNSMTTTELQSTKGAVLVWFQRIEMLAKQAQIEMLARSE